MRYHLRNDLFRSLNIYLVSWHRFAIGLLLLFSTGPISIIAQTPPSTPDAKGQDKRGLVLTSEPAEVKAPPANKDVSSGGVRPELVLQTGISDVSSIVFSPDGRLIASIGYGHSAIKLWETATGRELRALSDHTKEVNAISFNHDGRLLASGGADGLIKIWDVITGRAVRTLLDPGAMMISSIMFSPDSNMLAFVSTKAGGTAINLAEVGTGRLLRSIPGSFRDFTFSPDGRQLAAIEQVEYKIKVFDAATGRAARTVTLPDNPNEMMMKNAKAMAKEMMKDMMKVMSKGGTPNLAQLRTPVDTSSPGYKVGVSYTPDGRLLAYVTNGNSFSVWDANAKGKPKVLAGHRNMVMALAASRDGRFMASGSGDLFSFGSLNNSADTSVRLWDAAAGREVRAFTGHTGNVSAVAFSPDGRHLVSGGYDNTIRLWDTTTGREVRSMTGHTNSPTIAAFSSDGSRLASSSKTLWDLSTGRGLRVPNASNEAQIFSVMSNDGRILASAGNGLKLLDAKTGSELHTLMLPDPSVNVRGFFSPDGRLLASTAFITAKSAQTTLLTTLTNSMGVDSDSGMPRPTMKARKDDFFGRIQDAYSPESTRSIRLWDTATGRELRTFNLDTAARQIAFSADGRLIAAGGMNLGGEPKLINGRLEYNTPIKIWDIATGQEVRTLSVSAMMIEGVALSPDGRIIAAGSTDYTAAGDTKGHIQLWETATGRELHRLTGHSNMIFALAFSPDGRTLASGAYDSQIKLWDVTTGQELRNITGHTATVSSIAFSPDGRLLASTSTDNSTRLWDAKTGEMLATLVSLYDGGDWLVVTPDGLFDGSPAAWNQILWRYEGNTFMVAPIESFFNEFYHPGLLADIFAGKRPRATQDISQKDRRQPVIQLALTGGQQEGSAATTTARNVTVKIEVKEAPPDKGNSAGSGARDMRLFRNGTLVKVWRGDVLKGQGSATYEVTLPVVAGENRLTAYAFNRDNVKSKDALLMLRGAESLKRAGTMYILAVGVNEYANPQYNLKYAVADARSFGEELMRQQARLGRYGRIEVVPLFDKQATKANILAALKRLAGSAEEAPPSAESQAALAKLKPAEPEDTVVIYFAGHGTAQGQRFYLIPHDLNYSGERTRLDAAGLQSILEHSISDVELERAVEGVDASQLLMVIDACNSGQALEAEEKRRGPMNSKGLAQLAYEKGMYILTAAQSYQAALEASQLGHGYLTYALVEEGLKSPVADGQPKDGLLVAREWLDYATERVPQMQETKMKEAQGAGRAVAFVEGDEKVREPEKRSVQRPRVFYRRELEATPLIVAKP